MLQHVLSVVAFMIVSFAAQGLSHFVINKDHFASVSFMRPDPVIPLGLLVIVFQGALLSMALHVWKGDGVRVADGILVSLIFGAFLVSYIAIVEPSKYLVPSIGAWVRVELLVGFAQFAIFGVILGWIHQKL
ncbi:hypothetical protein E2K80_15200 [Rhodophyticola sp. CCM32]|uniref:hypothetical protein n=1 Tax=Rhodophyticola sp. CCM32 TaxID=2916397 RepID=UPI00107F2F24|nr:hypothetical protein [Rhodophyticola sp. CCM32]QBY01907.1 hypothetical protein E2K80_15200 [Rhodophyticola sp. CCM32]